MKIRVSVEIDVPNEEDDENKPVADVIAECNDYAIYQIHREWRNSQAHKLFMILDELKKPEEERNKGFIERQQQSINEAEKIMETMRVEKDET